MPLDEAPWVQEMAGLLDRRRWHRAVSVVSTS